MLIFNDTIDREVARSRCILEDISPVSSNQYRRLIRPRDRAHAQTGRHFHIPPWHPSSVPGGRLCICRTIITRWWWRHHLHWSGLGDDMSGITKVLLWIIIDTDKCCKWPCQHGAACAGICCHIQDPNVRTGPLHTRNILTNIDCYMDDFISAVQGGP